MKKWTDDHKIEPSFDITFSTTTAGATTIATATFKGKTAAGATEETYSTPYTTDFDNALPNIVRYKGGVAYYAVRIKHFGDSDTPWNLSLIHI